MNSAKAPKLPAELAMPSRLEGLLSLLVASPMTLLGCTPDEPPADSEGSSSGGPGGGTSSTGAVDSSSTGGGTSTGDGTTSTGSSSSGPDVSTSSTGPGDSSSSSSSEGGEESGTTDGGQGNTCERVGDLMNMCFGGGYGYYYESSCNYYINYFISIGDIACAQAYNEVYSCIADLECAEVFMGVYNACEVQYDNMYNVCWDWGSTTTFGWETESGGWDSGWWSATDSGWWGSEDSGVVFIVPPSESDGWSSGGWGTTGGT
jgi:hypothetical protein